MKPSLYDQGVHRISVDDIRQTGGVVIPSGRVDGHLPEIYICLDAGKSHVTQPVTEPMSARVRMSKTTTRPFLLNHIQKVPVVHDSVENRTQCESIVSTESGRETDDRHSVFGGGGGQIRRLVLSALDGVRALDTRVEVGKDVTVGGCGGVVCFIHDDRP